jgi:hypothetical protein
MTPGFLPGAACGRGQTWMTGRTSHTSSSVFSCSNFPNSWQRIFLTTDDQWQAEQRVPLRKAPPPSDPPSNTRANDVGLHKLPRHLIPKKRLQMSLFHCPRSDWSPHHQVFWTQNHLVTLSDIWHSVWGLWWKPEWLFARLASSELWIPFPHTLSSFRILQLPYAPHLTPNITQLSLAQACESAPSTQSCLLLSRPTPPLLLMYSGKFKEILGQHDRNWKRWFIQTYSRSWNRGAGKKHFWVDFYIEIRTQERICLTNILIQDEDAESSDRGTSSQRTQTSRRTSATNRSRQVVPLPPLTVTRK